MTGPEPRLSKERRLEPQISRTLEAKARSLADLTPTAATDVRTDLPQVSCPSGAGVRLTYLVGDSMAADGDACQLTAKMGRLLYQRK